MPAHYGQTSSEKIAEENQTCRQVVREIGNFGISERQRLFIIYLLALELEDVEAMKSVTSLVRELDNQTFIVDKADDAASSDV